MILEKNDIDRLGSYFIAANTPMYLYRKFIGDNKIINISENLTTDELLSTYNEINLKEQITFNELVTFYSCFFALFLKQYSEVKDFFLGLNNDSYKFLRWADRFRYIYFNYRKITIHDSCKIPLNLTKQSIQIFSKYSTSEDIVKHIPNFRSIK